MDDGAYFFAYSLILATGIFLCVFDPPLGDDDSPRLNWLDSILEALVIALVVTYFIMAFCKIMFY